MIILQLNCLFLKENQSKGCGDLDMPRWQDDCAAGATEVNEKGEPIGAASVMPATNATTEEGAEAEGTKAADATEATNATEATGAEGAGATNATETGAATVAAPETNETTGNVTLRKGIVVLRGTAAERRAARKAAREARRKAAAAACGINGAVGAQDNTTFRAGRRLAGATLKQTTAAPEQATNATETPQPAQEPTNKTAAQGTETQKGGQLEQKLQELISSIKETQDVTIRQLDELKNSDIINIVRPSGNGAKKEAAPATNETATAIVAPTENVTGAEQTTGTEEAAGTEQAAGTEEAAGTEQPAGTEGTEGAMTNATEATGAAQTTLRGERAQISDAKIGAEAGSEIVQETCDGPRYNRPECPCKLKRKLSRKMRREARRHHRHHHNQNEETNCLLQKQWDLVEKMKDNAPTIANAISDACTVVRAKASENSTAQGMSESKGSQTATSNGSGNSISVANAVGKTKSLTDSKAVRDSNSVGVTQSNTTGTADSTGSNGSVSIANSKNTNVNSNELCAADKSNTVGRTSTSSTAAATSNASDKSLASGNAIDNALSQSKLAAEDNSITVGNAEIASNAKATSTAANQSKAQTVSESTGSGNTDLKSNKNSRAVGNLNLTSASDTTADAVNGGNALGTAESKTCGDNEGAADNNSTIILNNNNANTATSNSKSTGTLEAANVTEATTGATNATTGATNATEQPSGTSLQGGRLPLKQTGNATGETGAATGDEAEGATTADNAQESGMTEEKTDICADFEKEDVKDIESMGFGDICDTEIKAAKETETDMEGETGTNGAAADTTLRSGMGAETEKTDNICDKTTLKSGVYRTESTCGETSFGQGIFRGDAHTKNICRNMCERMSLPRVKRAEIKAGNDGLTIFRCLCGTQYTSWFKPNYGVTSANGDNAAKLTRKLTRKTTRKTRKSLRQRANNDQTCGDNQEAGKDRATLRSERRAQREANRASLRAGDESEATMGSGCQTTRTATVVDLKPVVEEFIVNNANSIKSQSADNLNKIQNLLASKTQSGDSNGNGIC